MCNPGMAALALTASSAASAYAGARNRQGMAAYQAQVAANNAAVADIEAADALARGNRAAAETRRKYAALLGTQRASLAARGLDVTAGNANAILNDTGYFGAMDEQTVRTNAAREAWGYRVRATNARGDAAAFQATADATNPLLEAGLAGGRTLLGTGMMVAPRWYQHAGAWDAGGYTGNNDRGMLSFGSPTNQFLTYGRSGD